MNDPCIDPRICLDEDQIRALISLEQATNRNISAMIREGITMYIKVQRGEASYRTEVDTMLSPIVFEPNYRVKPDH